MTGICSPHSRAPGILAERRPRRAGDRRNRISPSSQL